MRSEVPIEIMHDGDSVSFDEFIADAAHYRVVLVGETHDRQDHHLNQLRIIKALHQRNPKLAIGLESFQTPYQPYLDAYVAGRISTEEMLRRTEYYQRWRYDFRLYEPVMDYARAHGIPLVALNVPSEIVRKVAESGYDSLTAAERRAVPTTIDRRDTAYRDRLRVRLGDHHGASGADFDSFYEIQLLWDEGMARSAAGYLARHADRNMVLLAGQGHIEYRSGIPARLQRRLDSPVLTVAHAYEPGQGREFADYVIKSSEVHLPPGGLLGVLIDPNADNAKIASLQEDGAARSVGVKTGDVITAINGSPVRDFSDVKISLWNKMPGDKVSLTLIREPEHRLSVDVTLR